MVKLPVIGRVYVFTGIPAERFNLLDEIWKGIQLARDGVTFLFQMKNDVLRKRE